jgi:hypothetical protein
MALAWRGAVVGAVALLVLFLAATVALPQPRPGVESTGGFYDKTRPERCYASEGEARADGCRRSKR